MYSRILIIVLFTGLALDPAKVQGFLTVNGIETRLTHGYALLHDNEEGILDAPQVRILLSDRELDPALLAAPALSRLDVMARRGEVRGLVFQFDPKAEDGEVYGTVLYPPVTSDASLAFFAEPATETGRVIMLTDDRVAARMTKETRRDPLLGDLPVFSYRIGFDLPVARLDPVTERLKGEEAVKSAPARALLAFESACRAGDLEAARKLATKGRMQELEYAVRLAAGDKPFTEQLRQWFPDETARTKHIVEVVLRGNRGVVVLEEEPGFRSGVPVVQVEGEWRID